MVEPSWPDHSWGCEKLDGAAQSANPRAPKKGPSQACPSIQHHQLTVRRGLSLHNYDRTSASNAFGSHSACRAQPSPPRLAAHVGCRTGLSAFRNCDGNGTNGVAAELTKQGTPFVFYSGQVDAEPALAEWPNCRILTKPALPRTIVATVAEACELTRSGAARAKTQ